MSNLQVEIIVIIDLKTFTFQVGRNELICSICILQYELRKIAALCKYQKKKKM